MSVKKSKFLSLILRHKPETIDLVLDKNGWADISYIIKNSDITRNELLEIVKNNDKQRFELNAELNPTKIRARQGHSTEVDVELSEVKINPLNPLMLYHGTPMKNVKSIMENGLSKMNRLHVHLTDNKETAKKTASRYSKDIRVLVIEFDGGINEPKLYKSNNGVYLSDHIPSNMIIGFLMNDDEKEKIIKINNE